MPPRSGTMRDGRSMCLVVMLAAFVAGPGCYSLRSSAGGGRAHPELPRRTTAADVALPAGYRIDVVAQELTFPTGVAIDDAGRVYVIESGYSYGEAFATPRLLRVAPDGTTAVIAVGDHPPWTGVVHQAGRFY